MLFRTAPHSQPDRLPPRSERADVVLVASSGGHLLELLELAGEYAPATRHWVTFDKPDARALLTGERVTYAYSPTNRHLGNLVRNAFLAVRLLFRTRPRAVITTGAGVGVPFLYAARAMRRRAIYVESLARIDQLSLTGRLVYPVVTHFFVQWPELARRYRRSRYVGGIL
jgi:UDP-N-acetylglucosamine:LPS N-acetylglucosamine transferase